MLSHSTLSDSFTSHTQPDNPQAGDAEGLVIDLDADTTNDMADRADVIDLTERSERSVEPSRLMAVDVTDTSENDEFPVAAQEDAPLPRSRSTRRSRPTNRQRSQPSGRGRTLELRRHSRARRYERLEAVFAWAEAHHRSVHTDALLMIVESEANFETWPPDCWTEHGLWQFLWSEVNTACVLAGRPEPRGMAETMWLYLEYLNQSIGLAAGSDPLDKLQEFLQEYGDLTSGGRPRTPNESAPSPTQFQLDLTSAA